MLTKKAIVKKTKVSILPSHVKVFNYIESYIKKNICAPELVEIAKGTRLSARQSYNLVNELVGLGYVEKQHRKKRGLKIIKKLA